MREKMDAFTSGELKPSDDPPMASPMADSVADASAKDGETGAKKEDASDRDASKDMGKNDAKEKQQRV